MAKALGYAHKKGIAHSDFKPGNVMVARDGTVKVLDFGLSRAVTNALKDDFDPFELGGMTPAYASPEMLANQPPEPADDVYALGIVAFELLTGRHPFNRRSANTENLRKLKLPMLRGLKRRQRAALERALAPNRASRQPDAEVFLRELRPQVGVRRSIYVVLSVLVAALAAVSYLNLRGEPPDVLYEDLGPASRQQFDKLTTLGDEFNSRGVYQSAFESYVRAYLISEREPRAVDRLESFFDEMTSQQDLPSNAATNLSCKLACLQTNFGYLAKNRTLTAANDTAVAVLKGKRPDCGRCPDYRKTYGVNN
jgi:serine/threonine protein kinase